VHTLIVWTAQYLLFVLAAVFVWVWLVAENRHGRIFLGIAAAFGLILMVGLLYLAKDVHHDPRPFVQNPHTKPLFAHTRDDGFPSDHSLAAALIAGLTAWRHRLIGALVGLGAAAIAWARVAAHVHHLQDVLAGLALGALAAVLAGIAAAWVLARIEASRRKDAAPASRTG
jgi:membrane-associated phospholipid phosphatase